MVDILSTTTAGALIGGAVFGGLFAALFPLMCRHMPFGDRRSLAIMASMPMQARIGLGVMTGCLMAASIMIDALAVQAGAGRAVALAIEAMVLIGFLGVIPMVAGMRGNGGAIGHASSVAN
jgi:hypothetical protein